MDIRDLLLFEPDAEERFSSLWLGYTESLGSPELRQAIAAQYERIGTDQVLVHAGAEEAIFNFMNVVLNPGDHIIVHAPYYQSLGEVARSIGAEVSEWQGNSEKAWELDLETLKATLTSHTKVVVVNFPHNPTGFLPTQEFTRELSELSEQHGFIIFADEVYRGLELDPSDRLTAFSDMNDRAVSLGVMSKTYGLAGLRIGWIATQDMTIFNKLAAFKDYTTICNSAPSEFLATLALRHSKSIVERNLRIISDNLAYLDSFFDKYRDQIHWYSPKAGSITFPTLLQGSVDEFCDDLIEKAGVLLLPGTLYGEKYNSFRVGFGRKNLPEALEKFGEYMQGARASVKSL